MSVFADNVSKLRASKGISQRELAGRLGVSKSTVGNWEASSALPDMEMMETIADFFGVRLGALFMDDLDVSVLSPWTTARVLGSIAAGTPIEMIEADSTASIPTEIMRAHPRSFYLKVDGESMNRVLPNGCYALVDPDMRDVRDNRAYAVCVNGYDATVKRVRKLANGFQLVPDSDDPTYPVKTYNYNEEGTETITVIGEVVWYSVPFGFEI